VSDSAPYVDFALDFQVLECLGAEFGFSKRTGASGDWTGRGAVAEYSVDARLAHFVVAFWIDFELHVGVEIARRFADGANV
jgi:hypothetical protein